MPGVRLDLPLGKVSTALDRAAGDLAADVFSFVHRDFPTGQRLVSVRLDSSLLGTPAGARAVASRNAAGSLIGFGTEASDELRTAARLLQEGGPWTPDRAGVKQGLSGVHVALHESGHAVSPVRGVGESLAHKAEEAIVELRSVELLAPYLASRRAHDGRLVVSGTRQAAVSTASDAWEWGPFNKYRNLRDGMSRFVTAAAAHSGTSYEKTLRHYAVEIPRTERFDQMLRASRDMGGPATDTEFGATYLRRGLFGF